MSDHKSATKRSRDATSPLAEAPSLPTTVGIRDLRDHLSRYLEMVKAGASVSVTDHGRVVAAIVPMTYSQHMLDLAAKGYVTLPRLPKSATVDWPRVPIEGGTDDLIDWAKGERLP